MLSGYEEAKQDTEIMLAKWLNGQGISESMKASVCDFLFSEVHNLRIDLENLRKKVKYGEA